MRPSSTSTLFALSALFVACGRSEAETANEIVQKAIEAHGGADNLNKYKAAKETSKGKITIMGLEMSFDSESVHMLPDRLKNVIKLDVSGQKISIVQIFNGGKVKMTTNGMDTPLNDAQKAEIKDSLRLQLIQTLTPLLNEKTFTLSLLDKADKVEGKEVSGVLVKAKDVKDIKLYFDKKSNLLVKIERRGLDPEDKEVNQEMILKDYKKIEGLMQPTKTTLMMDGKKFMESELVDYKHLEKVDKKEFDVSD